MSTQIQSDQIQSEHFVEALNALFTETFESVQGHFLDKGTSLFETLAAISAEEASIPVGGKCATLAAQIKHVTFYLGVLEDGIRNQRFEKQDWNKIWRETSSVTQDEWREIQEALRASYTSVRTFVNERSAWSSADDITGAISIIVHTAYHLGEIRQALCVLKP